MMNGQHSPVCLHMHVCFEAAVCVPVSAADAKQQQNYEWWSAFLL